VRLNVGKTSREREIAEMPLLMDVSPDIAVPNVNWVAVPHPHITREKTYYLGSDLDVRALTPIERHDLVWVERINAAIQTGFESLSLANQDIVALLSANAQIAEQLRAFAAEFWAGTEAPHERRGTRVSLPLWQYLTERVEVLGCEKLA
jgi:hypothetical protein